MINLDDIDWTNTPAESNKRRVLTMDEKLAHLAGDEDVLMDDELEGL